MPTVPASRLLPSIRRSVLGRLTPDRSDGQLLTAFVTERDSEAFAGIVRRHGPMILGVCRRVVGDVHAAEDAFQAAFIVLARRAASIKSREQVGNWLYGVAYRTALKARAVLARRQSREKQVETMPEPAVKPPADVWPDLQVVIDEELNHLPDKLRLPVVLCDLEGRTQRAVAAQLKLPPATLATRLASARRILAERLTKRGIALSGGALAMLLGDRAAAALVPAALAESVVQTAGAVALGVPASTLASAHVVQISEGVMRMMLVAKLKTLGAAVLSMLVLIGGFGFGLLPAQAGDEPTVRVIAVKQPDAKAQPAPKPANDGEFLNRLCLDLRGTPATLLERFLFAGDTDPNKRAKVVEWFLADENVKQFLAKQFNVKVEAIQSVKAVDVGDGRPTVIVTLRPDVKALAFSPDGKYLAVEESVRVRLRMVPESDVKTLLFVDGQEKGIVNEKYAETVWELVVKQPDPTRSTVRLFDATTGKQVGGKPSWRTTTLWVDDPVADLIVVDGSVSLMYDALVWDSDNEFLRRSVTSARGTPPTAIEEKYFAEDKDPKKREKLLDALLNDPAVQKKVGVDWKKQMLASQPYATTDQLLVARTRRHDATKIEMYTTKLRSDAIEERLAKLVDALLAAKKPDDQVFDGIALTVLGRLPTESEKSLTLAGVAKAPDRRAAWLDVANALAGTNEAKKHVDAIKGPTAVPPAKP